MTTSLFVFPTDMAGEGLDRVLERAAAGAGVDTVALAAAYHDARDLFPHNPGGRVRFLEPGTVAFKPDPARWSGLRLQPLQSPLARAGDPLGELCVAAPRHGLAVEAWTVFLHSDRLGFEHPDCAPRNAFGDPYLTDLCPSHPDVRAYARALAGDVAGRGVTAVVAESLHFHPFEHGYHHERTFIELSEGARLMLGICFCTYCMAAARALHVDADAVQAQVRSELERALAGADASPPDGLDAYREARMHTVTTLAGEVSRAVRAEGAKLRFMDASGAVRGYSDGRPQGPPTATGAPDLGIDLAALAEATIAIDALGYAADPERLRADLEGYRDLAPEADLGLVLRPMPPDCGGADNLVEKVALARAAGVERIGFYAYGFMQLHALAWVRAALS